MSSAEPTPISCREAVELVTDYVEGILDAEGRAAVERGLLDLYRKLKKDDEG